MTRYQEHLDQRRRWRDGAEAELQGFIAAEVFPAPKPYSTDPYIQGRYLEGFIDGQYLRNEDAQARKEA